MNTFKTRWASGSEFMAWRQGRLGLLRTVLGTSFEVALRLVQASNRRYESCESPFPTRHGPISIFVLRNNDLGDVICSTPLFAALRQGFPRARIVAGVGRWAEPILSQNPNVDEVLVTDAPWYNKFVPDRSVPAALRYIMLSDQVRELASRRFEVGIDVLGSHFGALLLRQARIPWRLGVRGYAGGHSLCQQSLEFEPNDHVARFATKFAGLLGAPAMPEPRPQIFLRSDERAEGESFWHKATDGDRTARRLVIGTGDGVIEKYWPLDSYIELSAHLAAERNVRIVLVGGAGDHVAGEKLVAVNRQAINLCGALSLRQTFSLVAAADVVACNASMLMHASGALGKPAAVLLGRSFPNPDQHYRQWCYEGVSFYPPNSGPTLASTPSGAMILLRGLLRLP
jgi:ADP-heptose:LPS heptosyltransferase